MTRFCHFSHCQLLHITFDSKASNWSYLDSAKGIRTCIKMCNAFALSFKPNLEWPYRRVQKGKGWSQFNKKISLNYISVLCFPISVISCENIHWTQKSSSDRLGIVPFYWVSILHEMACLMTFRFTENGESNTNMGHKVNPLEILCP